MQCCKRVAWTDTEPAAKWASSSMPLFAATLDTGLPCMLVFTPLRPALVTLAEPLHLPITATFQRPRVNATAFGGLELCCLGTHPSQVHALHGAAICAASHTLGSLSCYTPYSAGWQPTGHALCMSTVPFFCCDNLC